MIDPTKVTRTALENAASVSSLLITTEAVVYEKKEKEPANAANASRRWYGRYVLIDLLLEAHLRRVISRLFYFKHNFLV